MQQPADGSQRRRLAGAVRPDERDDLLRLDLERDALERLDIVVEDMNVVDFEKSHAVSLLSPPGSVGISPSCSIARWRARDGEALGLPR